MKRTPFASISARAATMSSTRKPASGSFMNSCWSAIARGPKISKVSPSSSSKTAKSSCSMRGVNPRTSFANVSMSSYRSVGLPSHTTPLTFNSLLPDDLIEPFDRARPPGRLVDVDHDTVELDRPAGDLEAAWHSVAETRDDDVLIYAQHGIARTDHTGVRHMRRALREHARIGRRHVGVRADDGREAAVEMPAHRDLLTRRLGVPVENAHARRVAPELFEQRVDRAERVVRRRHEGAADGIHDEDILDHDPAAPRIARREIDRPDREREELDVVEELPLIPDVIPIRDDVRAVRVELARDVGGKSCSTRGVLAVHDREVDLALRADLR